MSMMRYRYIAAVFALFVAQASANPLSACNLFPPTKCPPADDHKIKNVRAWTETSLSGQTTLRVTGKVESSNPCYDVRFIVEESSTTYDLLVHFVRIPGVCSSVIWDVPFNFTRGKYAGKHSHVRVQASHLHCSRNGKFCHQERVEEVVDVTTE